MELDKLYKFNEETISNAPRQDGVYLLYDGDEIIYIGKGEGEGGISGRLQDHKAGREGECTQNATAYAREVCDNPLQREEQLLIAYKQKHGKLPRCNKRIG